MPKTSVIMIDTKAQGDRLMVLSIGTDGDSAYYLKHMASYDADGVEATGRWYMPEGAPLPLVDGADIDAEIFRNLMDGRWNGETIGKPPSNPRLKRASSYDLTFSCPKSVSILWALADSQMRGRIERIVEDSVRAVLGFMQDHCAFLRKVKNGRELEEVTYFGALFQHGDARPMEDINGNVVSDMSLHFHSVIMNVVKSNDGGWNAVDARHLMDWKMALGATQHAELSRRLEAELRCRTEVVGSNGEFKIVGVPDELIEQFSRRRQLIEETLKDIGTTSSQNPALAASVARSSREKKREGSEAESAVARFDRWCREAADAGFQPEAVTSCIGQWHPTASDIADRDRVFQDAVKRAAFEVTETEGLVELRDVYRYVASMAAGHGKSIADIVKTAEVSFLRSRYRHAPSACVFVGPPPPLAGVPSAFPRSR